MLATMFEDKMNLNKWFSFKEVGMYEVHGSYYLDFQDPEDGSWNTSRATIIPAIHASQQSFQL
jgi:hypothetical protein